ncbi:MAG: L,D-transpeptidase family protein [Hyphomicrobiaceae bacterium]|nr:L,D-transpeptidase family protein [Hyphomicrobiaceae bacterium]
MRASDDGDSIGQGLDGFPSDGPLLAVVSLSQQKISVWDRNGVVASSPVSTGRKGYETPEGVFSIIERKEEHFSNLYDDASMPFMQRITWSGVALHAGVVPGYRASHGCIRLPEDFAERLFRTSRIATRVVIVPHAGQPAPISHPALFQPSGEARAQSGPPHSSALRPAPGFRSGPDGTEAPMMLGARHLPRPAEVDGSLASPEAGQVIPRATPLPTLPDLKSEQAAVAKRLAVATKELDQIKSGVRPRLIEQGKAEKALRQAIALTRRSEGRAAAAGMAVSTARGERAVASAQTSHLEALMALAEARGRESAARDLAAATAVAVAVAQDAVKAADAKRQELANLSRALWRRMQPVTVLVSRQTGRVYVRQAFNPVVDLPVAITDPGRAIGTHVFTALEGKLRSKSLDWVGLTIETPGGGIPAGAEPETPPGKRKKAEKVPPSPTGDPLLSARAALERIALPPEALARILPSLQPGSTVIVSDRGPSIETGPGTDIVIQTRGEEQAAANIAKFVAKKKAEEGIIAASYKPEPRRSERGREGRRSGDWQRW